MLDTNGLRDLITYEKVLFILTGVSGSGKTTFAEELKSRIPQLKSFSVDDAKVSVYTTYGFINKSERGVLHDLAIANFKTSVMLQMGRVPATHICVDYPFTRAKWQDYFDDMCKLYGYVSVVVYFNSRPFDEIWKSRITRDSSVTERHPSLVSEFYSGSDNYRIDPDKFSDEKKSARKAEYESGYYTSLLGNYVIDDMTAYQLVKELSI